MNTPQPDNGGIILFDGVCNFCNATVRFVYARDPEARFRFAPLQSEIARDLLTQHGAKEDDEVSLDSVVLLMDGRVYHRSDAALTIAGKLRFPWPLMKVFRIVPKGIRDWVYDFIGQRRYRWFGRSDSCPLPPPDLGRRFL